MLDFLLFLIIQFMVYLLSAMAMSFPFIVCAYTVWRSWVRIRALQQMDDHDIRIMFRRGGSDYRRRLEMADRAAVSLRAKEKV